jgi:hypothetical protein
MVISDRMSDLPLPVSKAGGRSVSISEERQFGVSTIYRSVGETAEGYPPFTGQ